MRDAADPPIVAVTGGRLAGTVDDGVAVFRGVPFAAPLAGANRWRAPQPVTAWEGIRDSTRFGFACPQPSRSGGLVRWKRTGRAFLDAISVLGAPTGEACLNLNIWTPAADRAAKLPVLVFIHGGSFTGGAGSQPIYDGRQLAQAGLVVVTINYRLGVLGFIGGEDLFPDGLGGPNRGYLDQVAALRWVAENIAAFGGDPDCVTVMGESAGAASVLMMASTPATKGLIRRAISLSGALMAYPHDECRAFAADYLATLDVKPGDSEALVALTDERMFKARTQPGQFLARNRTRYGSLGADHLAALVAATGTELFPEPPLDFMRRGDLDLLIGTCRDETRFLSIVLPMPSSIAARMMFNLHDGVMKPRGRPAETFRAYRAAMPGASSQAVCERATTDAMFRKSSVAVAEAAAEASPGRAFLYRYDWPSSAMGGVFAAMHGLDLPGVFQTYGAMEQVVGPEAEARVGGDKLHAAVVSFAKTGKPSIPEAPDWPAYEPKTKPSMVIDRTCAVREAIDAPFEPIW